MLSFHVLTTVAPSTGRTRRVNSSVRWIFLFSPRTLTHTTNPSTEGARTSWSRALTYGSSAMNLSPLYIMPTVNALPGELHALSRAVIETNCGMHEFTTTTLLMRQVTCCIPLGAAAIYIGVQHKRGAAVKEGYRLVYYSL